MCRPVLVLVILLAVAYGQTAVSPCTRHPGDLPLSVNIEGCTAPPCGLAQLRDAVIDVEFVAPRNISSMTTLATAYLFIFPIPYDLRENAVTCNFLQNTACPVARGQLVRYQLRMFIESLFPVGVSPTIEFRVVDESSQPLVCLQVAVTIQPPVAQVAS